jgi:hypothetical protein
MATTSQGSVVHIKDADYWWYRAEELRAKAHGMRDLDARRTLLNAAEACEDHARLLEARRVQEGSSV